MCVCLRKTRAVDKRRLGGRFAGSAVKHQQAPRKGGGCNSLSGTH